MAVRVCVSSMVSEHKPAQFTIQYFSEAVIPAPTIDAESQLRLASQTLSRQATTTPYRRKPGRPALLPAR